MSCDGCCCCCCLTAITNDSSISSAIIGYSTATCAPDIYIYYCCYSICCTASLAISIFRDNEIQGLLSKNSDRASEFTCSSPSALFAARALRKLSAQRYSALCYYYCCEERGKFICEFLAWLSSNFSSTSRILVIAKSMTASEVLRAPKRAISFWIFCSFFF
jgi:hypothetical protein